MINIELHSEKQHQVVTSETPLTVAATGTQWGKSQAGALWLKIQVHKNPGANFLLMAPNYKIMHQSALPYFSNCMEGLGLYKATNATFELAWGGKVYLRTATDPDSIVGVPNVRAYWLDEAGKVSLYFWENIQARAASKGAIGLLTTSPYSRNWMYTQLIRPHSQGKPRDGLTVIQAQSWENPYHSYHDPAKREHARSLMDTRRFDMLYGGEWGQMVGLVFDCFDEDLNQIEPFHLPTGTVYIGGVDWGYTEPFVHLVRAITPAGRHYQVSEFYKSSMTPSQQLDVIEQKTKIYGISRHWCGHDQPGLIQELRKRGITANAADFDIMRGNGIHYELIQSRMFKIFKGSSPHTLDEYSTYHYPEPTESLPDRSVKDMNPVGRDDHAMAVSRYITLHEYRSHLTHTPKTPGETPNQALGPIIDRLKDNQSSAGHSEKWK